MTQILYKPGYHASWALLIGINQYQTAPPLSYASNDAASFQALLTSSLGFPVEQVVTLKDTQATKARILDEFISFHRKAHHQDDRVVFFFAGHGHTVQGSKGAVGYLVPFDGNVDNLASLIRWDDITRNAELINAKHILFVMDACYSGLALRRVVTPGIKRFISELLQRSSRQVITAGKADQTVADGGGPSGMNSIFTGYLLEGLNGAASNSEGILTANSLMAYVYEKVGQHPLSSQTPHYGHIDGDGDFVLVTPGQEHLKPELASDYLVEADEEVHEVIDGASVSYVRPSFALQCGYGDAKHPSFGRNGLSSNLGEYRVNTSQKEIVRAFSWLGVVVQPLANQPVSIDIAQKARESNKIYNQGTDPHEKFSFPSNLRTTFSALLLYSDIHDTQDWGRYLRIEESGNIEFADTENVFIEVDGLRIFKFIQVVGLAWQILFLAKNLLTESGYRSGVRITFSLVGTQNTILANFSQELGRDKTIWRDPLVDPFGLRHISDRSKCTDLNLRIDHDLVIGRLTYDESVKVFRSIAGKIELAFNHSESPRCFNVDTDTFPWKQYLADRRW
jgi:uncharacterized caspase-like protein